MPLQNKQINLLRFTIALSGQHRLWDHAAPLVIPIYHTMDSQKRQWILRVMQNFLHASANNHMKCVNGCESAAPREIK